MTWTAGEIAGFIGAAAWIPHASRWIITHFTRPRITILTGPNAEIGYTSFGPILNLSINLSAERHDVVVNGLKIKLKHESGDQRLFIWQGSRTTFSQLKDATGTAVGSFEQDTDATAFKVTTQAVFESFFRFQEKKFIEAKEPLFNSVVEHEVYLATSDKNKQDELLKSVPMHQLKAFHRDSFWWESGTYVVEFELSALTKIKVFRRKFQFSLSSSAVEKLRENIDTIPHIYEHMLKADVEGYNKPEPVWNWQSHIIRAE